MQIADMPTGLELLVTASDKHRLAVALQNALGRETQFHCYEPVMGTPASGRLFSVLPHPRGKPIKQSLAPHDIAHELINFTGEARYPERPCARYRKGWELYKFDIVGRPAVVAWAAWISD